MVDSAVLRSIRSHQVLKQFGPSHWHVIDHGERADCSTQSRGDHCTCHIAHVDQGDEVRRMRGNSDAARRQAAPELFVKACSFAVENAAPQDHERHDAPRYAERFRRIPIGGD